MSETVNPPTILRNNVSKVMSLLSFSKKSDLAGKTVFGPQVSLENFQSDIEWIGTDYVMSALNADLKVEAGEIHTECIDKTTGLLDEALRNSKLADFTAGLIKLSVLREQYNDLVSKQDLNTNGPDGLVVLMDKGLANDAPEIVAILKSLKELSDQITPLRSEIAKKEVELKTRLDARKAAAAAAEAKAKADQAAAATASNG